MCKKVIIYSFLQRYLFFPDRHELFGNFVFFCFMEKRGKKMSGVNMLSFDLILRCYEKLLSHPLQLVYYLWTEFEITGKIHPNLPQEAPGPNNMSSLVPPPLLKRVDGPSEYSQGDFFH